MDHPNVLPLLDTYVRAKGLERFIVMPFCEGGSLEYQLYEPDCGLANGRDRLQIAAGITEGLRYLHSQKVYHRDLKPANVVLTASLHPFLTDVGVSARVVLSEEDAEKTSYETVRTVGTPGYDAPEAKFQIFGAKVRRPRDAEASCMSARFCVHVT